MGKLTDTELLTLEREVVKMQADKIKQLKKELHIISGKVSDITDLINTLLSNCSGY